MDDRTCRSGTTRDQMMSAPYESIYVWVNSNLSYPIRLAGYIQRKDLKIVPPSWLDGRNHRGRMISNIIVDHAAHLSNKEFKVLLDIKDRIKNRG